MPSLAQRFRSGLNDLIFDRLGEAALIDGVEHKGIFNRRYREFQIEDGTLVGAELTFDCSFTKQVEELKHGDPIEIDVEGNGTRARYLFRRRLPRKGDETGRVILELML